MRKGLRNESLEINNARDSERVVRLFVEVDVVSDFSSSTTQDKRKDISKFADVLLITFQCTYLLLS